MKKSTQSEHIKILK